MKYFFFIIIILSGFACATNRKVSGTMKDVVWFKAKLPYGTRTITQYYKLTVPRGGKLKKGSYDFTGDYHLEYRIVYPDSSILYIGNDNWRGSKLNVVNRVSIGVRAISRKNEHDSLFFDGIQSNGRCWRENILGDIIVGYVNVHADDKAKYEQSVQSVRNYRKNSSN
jgi:hypothetical protein